jgi:hypothetical protein
MDSTVGGTTHPMADDAFSREALVPPIARTVSLELFRVELYYLYTVLEEDDSATYRTVPYRTVPYRTVPYRTVP